MSSLIDRYSPQTPITEDEKRAGTWFQRWLSRLQDAVDPEWSISTPIVSGADLLVSNGMYYRDRGNTFEIVVDFNVNIPVATTIILLDSPVQDNAFGSISGSITQDFANYYSITGLYANTPVKQIYSRIFDSRNFPLGFMNFTLSGFFQRR